MDSFWQGFVTTTYATIQDNWHFFLYLFGAFIAIMTLRWFFQAFSSIKSIFKGR